MLIVTVPGADVRGPSDAVYVKEVVTFFRGSTGVSSCGCVPKTFVAGVAKLLTKNFGIVASSLMFPNWYDSWLKILRTGRVAASIEIRHDRTAHTVRPEDRERRPVRRVHVERLLDVSGRAVEKQQDLAVHRHDH